ncbi:MAG: ABC transporter substrate-binding protein [Clostridia bacterium]
MNFKKLFALLTVVLMIAGCFVACAPAATTTPTEPTTEAAPAEEATEAPVVAAEVVDPTKGWGESYDALLTQIKTTTDFEERAKLMHQAEDILMSTGAICPIYYYNDLYMQKPTVEGFYANAYGFKYFLYCTNADSKTLRINIASEPDRLDPALNSSVDGACLAVNSFGGLYTYSPEGKLVPQFATDFTMSEDGLTYVFTIRDGLKWSDGSPLTAKDFEYSWKRAANPDTAADYAYMFNAIKGYGAPEGIDVTASEDGKTLTIVLNAPCAYFLDLAAFPAYFAVKQDVVESAKGYKDAAGAIIDAGAWATEAGFVSSGAYTLKEWKHNESMTYVKNPNYYDAENVKIETIEYMLSADDTAIYAAYQAGNLDFIDTVPADEIQALLTNPEFHVIDQLGTYYIVMNVKSKLFDGKTPAEAAAMRRALSILIDRSYIIETVAQTGQKLATSFLPLNMLDGNGKAFKDAANWEYPNGSDGYYSEEVDVEGATALLKSAGFKFTDGKLDASNPITFEYLTNDGSAHVQIAECVQQDLAAVGITMTVKSVDWDTFLAERKAGNYDIARNGWIADFSDPVNMLEMWGTDSGNNDAQFGR